MNPTPGQTIGPFFGFSLPHPGDAELVPAGSPGAIRVHGRVLDGAGEPVPDALLEIWQADPAGRVLAQPGSLRRDGWTFTGWGRAATDRTGHFAFSTWPPGRTAADRLPFFAVTVFARGLLDRLLTRCYPPASADELTADPLLATLPEDRRRTLVATPDAQGLVFDVVLQGPGETVFLAYPR